MTPQLKALDLFTRMKGFRVKHSHSKKCAMIAVDNEYNGIINVIVDLKGRGELSDKIYLKALNDLNKEREEVKSELLKL